MIQKVYAVVKTTPLIESIGGITNIGELFTWLTNIIIIIGFGMVVVFLALGFIRFVTSQGDKLATEQAQKWVSYAALGGVGLLAVYTIKAVILSLTGVDEDPLKAGN